MDRQNQVIGDIREIRMGMYQMHESMHQIERKLDRIPKNGESRRRTGITIGGAWFKDLQSLLLWIAIAGMVVGHANADFLRQIALMK